MKALTLTQPWATLVAIGAKKIETRSWSTNYRGPLAIHAAANFPYWAKQMCWDSEFSQVLNQAGFHIFDLVTGATDLPLGVIVATCELVKVEKIMVITELPTDPEWSFGDYTVGRFMWHLAKVRKLEHPVPTRGALGLWEWDD